MNLDWVCGDCFIHYDIKDKCYDINQVQLCQACYERSIRKSIAELQRKSEELNAKIMKEDTLKEMQARIDELEKAVAEKDAIIQDEVKIATKKWEAFFGEK